MVILSTLHRHKRSSRRLPSGLCDWPSCLRDTGLSVRLDVQVMEGTLNLTKPLRGTARELTSRRSQSLTKVDCVHAKQLCFLPSTYLSPCPCQWAECHDITVNKCFLLSVYLMILPYFIPNK